MDTHLTHPPLPRRRCARARRVWQAVVVVGLLAPMILAVTPSAPAAAARTIHVATWGDDAASGSAATPLRTVGRAVAVASSGDTVMIAGGVYRESIVVRNKQVALTSAPGQRVVFDGARAVNGWTAAYGRWFSQGWTRQFHAERSGSVRPGNLLAGYPDQMFLDGRPLRQVLSIEAVVPGTFFHEVDADRLWIGDDPTGALVEASDLAWAFYFAGADGSRLSGVTVRRYATQGFEMAAIRGYSDRLVFENLLVEHNARIGLSAIGERIVVRDSRFVDNGHLGLHAHLAATLVVDRVAVIGNNKAGFDPLHSAGGVKITTSRGVTVRDSDVSYNGGPGIWTDLATTGATIVRNLTEHNARSGIEIELSTNVNVIGNVSLGNGETGIWILESSNVEVFNNATYENLREIWVQAGPRSEMRNVRVRNNLLGAGKRGSPAVLNVDDWTGRLSAAAMNVTSDHNAFWMPPGAAPNISRWARWPQPLAYADTLATHRERTGQDRNSVVSTAAVNPFVRSPATVDFRAWLTTPLGAPVVGSMAEQLRMRSGMRPRIGPTEALVRRSGTPPPSEVWYHASRPLVAVEPRGGAAAVRVIRMRRGSAPAPRARRRA